MSTQRRQQDSTMDTTNTTKELSAEEQEVAGPFLEDDAVLIKNLNFSYGDRQVRTITSGILVSLAWVNAPAGPPPTRSAPEIGACVVIGHLPPLSHRVPHNPLFLRPQVLKGINMRLKKGSRYVRGWDGEGVRMLVL